MNTNTLTAQNSVSATRNGAPNTTKNTIIAKRMEPGDSLYLQHPQVPESKILVPDFHFEYRPPYKGRVSRQSIHRDTSACAVFTAKVPLLVAIHNPWADGKGCQTIGHARLAIEAGGQFDIVGEAALELDFRLRDGCRDAQYSEHVVLGGPANAVVYQTEMVLPAYRWDRQPHTLPFCYIAQRDDEELVRRAAARGGRMMRQARMGETPSVSVLASSVHKRMQVGAVLITYDSAGWIHGLEGVNEMDGKKSQLTFYRFQGGITVRLNELVTNPKLRAKLEIEALPVVDSMVSYVPKALPKPSIGGAPTGALLDQVKVRQPEPAAPVESVPEYRFVPEPKVKPAKPKAVPTAVRRAEAPKLAEVAPAAEVREEVAAPTSVLEILQLPAEPPVEEKQPEVAGDVQTSPEAEARPGPVFVIHQDAPRFDELTEKGLTASEALQVIDGERSESPALNEFTSPGVISVTVEAFAELVQTGEVTADAIDAALGTGTEEEDILHGSKSDTTDAAALSALAFNIAPEVQETDPLIALLMEEFDGHPLPLLACNDGHPIAIPGDLMTEAVAKELVELYRADKTLLLHPALGDFMERFMAVLELEG